MTGIEDCLSYRNRNSWSGGCSGQMFDSIGPIVVKTVLESSCAYCGTKYIDEKRSNCKNCGAPLNHDTNNYSTT
jgi:hypothetical protein